MKKYLVALALMFPLVVFAQTFDHDLYFGIQGDSDVTKLQEFLANEGVYSGSITGNFFSLTLAGVKSFQSREGITPSAGYFGPLTRTKANAILSQQLQASNEQAVAETSSTPPVPTPPATTNDIQNSLQTQLNLLIQQVALLQKQLAAQQQTNQTLQQIQQNTTPVAVVPQPSTPPSIPIQQSNLVITTSSPPYFSGGNHIYSIEAFGEPFSLDVITVTVADKQERAGLNPNGISIRSNNPSWRGGTTNQAWWNGSALIGVDECQGVESLFKSYTSAPYPYPCPGRDINTPQEYDSAPLLGYTAPAIDWQRYRRYTVVFNPGDIYTIEGLQSTGYLVYLRATGTKTGKVVEVFY